MKTFLKLAVFVTLFCIGFTAIKHDYFTNMHEEGHIYNYTRDGVDATRRDFRTVKSDYYTFNGLIGGYGSVFVFAIVGYFVSFFISFRQYWITGFFMGLSTSAFMHPWGGTDFNQVASMADSLWNTWIYGYGGFLLGVYVTFIVWKMVPEIYYIATGKRISGTLGNKKNHPYHKEPTYLP